MAVDAVEYPIPEVWSQSPSDLRSLCSSLKQIRDLLPRHVIPAHGQTSEPSIVDANIAYFSRLRDAIAGSPEDLLQHRALNEQSGFRVQDFVTLPVGMPLETRAFYQRCHKSNLEAVVAARLEGMEFI